MRRATQAASLLSCLSFGQPPAAQAFGWDTGQVGFDIENGCSIQHIDATNMQLAAFAVTQFHDGQANRVRTARRSGGKHAMRPIVGRRCTRSEEHTSELCHLVISYAVFCLKKKKKRVRPTRDPRVHGPPPVRSHSRPES